MRRIQSRFITGPEIFWFANLCVHFLALKMLPAGAVKGLKKGGGGRRRGWGEAGVRIRAVAVPVPGDLSAPWRPRVQTESFWPQSLDYYWLFGERCCEMKPHSPGPAVLGRL